MFRQSPRWNRGNCRSSFQPSMVMTVRTKRVCFSLSLLLVGLISVDAAAQSRSPGVRKSERVARASWSPTRTAHDASFQTARPVRQASATSSPTQRSRVMHDQQISSTQKPLRQQPVLQQPVRLAQHVVTSPTVAVPASVPLDGQVYYESAVGCDSGACDAMGPTCGCGSIACDGCDSIGSCGPGCGCSMCGELPSGPAWRPAVTLSLPQDGWISYEALHWQQDGMYLPALITTSPAGTLRADAGVLTRAGTSTLFGDDEYVDNTLDGGRLRFGIWLDRCHTLGIGAEFFDLGVETDEFSLTSSGSPIAARPFYNVLTGSEDSELIAFPGVVSGVANVRVSSELKGSGFHFRKLRCCDSGCDSWLFCGCKDHYCTRMDFRLGYRYVELDESVVINERLDSTDTSNLGSFDITDSFRTVNQFNGLDLGWSYRMTRGYWTYESLVRLAIGNNNQTVTVAGTSVISDPNDPPAQTFNEGFLALASNSGTFEQDEFAVIPELNLNLGYQLTDHLKATLGYTAIYWSNVVRPGQHIPTDLNPSYLPPASPQGDPRPLFAFDTVDYWVHGINYGLEYRW